MADLPRYDELPVVAELGLRHAWGVFGDGDRLGTLNLLAPQRVAAAAAGVRTGEVVSLDLPLDVPDPPLFGRRRYEHHVFALNRNEMDDRLDGFHLQGSTQWDALSHVRCRQFGYWGGRTVDPTTGANDLGIDHVADHGLAGRGVLLDVSRWAADQGRPFHPLEPHQVTAGDLLATLEHQGTVLEPGDILCIRVGWPDRYRALDAAARAAYAERPTSAGLRADEDVARLLWDAHVAAVASDNPAVEVVPGDPDVGSLHRRLIPLLGVTLGEMFDLDHLARRCAEQRRWDFLFVAAPLKVPGGVGSPGNAVAIL
jgi:kynurenine formamidase